MRMTEAVSFLSGVIGSVIGVFIEIHFDLAGKYEQYRYRKHVEKLDAANG